MVRQPRGFTYIGVLFVVAMMATGLALIGEVWHTSNVREKEAELLHIGNEYRKAVERFYLDNKRYPKELADLIKDPNHPGTRRHLRRLYPDPVTGKEEWGLVKSPDGGFAGVYSLSEEAPLKTAGFAVRDATFEGKAKYAEWQFVFAPPAAPAAKPAAGGKPAADGKPGAAPPAPPAMQSVFPDMRPPGATPQSSSSSSSSRP